MNDLLSNVPLIAALAATMVAQLLKVLLVLLAEKRWAFDRLLDTGGMPSSHSAAVSALAISLGVLHGWGSPAFAISCVLGSIVMYDATGIRRAAGRHAEMINEMVKELSHLFDEGFQPQVLKTLLGHTYPQVIVGALLGITTALVATL